MLRTIFELLKPPSRREIYLFWKPLGVGFTLVLVLYVLDFSDNRERSVAWHLLATIMFYIVIILPFIEDRYEKRNKK